MINKTNTTQKRLYYRNENKNLFVAVTWRPTDEGDKYFCEHTNDFQVTAELEAQILLYEDKAFTELNNVINERDREFNE